MLKKRVIPKTLAQRKKIYRSRIRRSRCRKLGQSVCSKRIKCKMANGKTKRYCRKLRNRHT